MLLRLIAMFLISFSVYANEEAPVNFCLDEQSAKENEELARKHPNDEIIVRLVAMRSGLCNLIDRGIVDLEFAIELFDIEHQKGIYKRIQEEQETNRNKGA